MQVHPRYFKVRTAHSAVSEAVLKIIQEHDLTYLEMIGILLEEAMAWKMYALRVERHPKNPDKKADEA